MYLIILAAGQGTRLRPLTDEKPKCLVEVAGRSLLEWQIRVAKRVGLDQIAVVRGYRKELISYPGITYFHNPSFETTNMVSTLLCARPVFGEEFIVSYGDILYEPVVLEELLRSSGDVSVVVDREWRGYWEKRFDDALDDAETLKINGSGRITSIGQIPESIDDIQAQYIGLTLFRRQGIEAFNQVYAQAEQDVASCKKPLRGQRDLPDLYMTDLLQGIVDSGYAVYPVPVDRGWLEIDSPRDLELAEQGIVAEGDDLRITC